MMFFASHLSNRPIPLRCRALQRVKIAIYHDPKEQSGIVFREAVPVRCQCLGSITIG